MTLGLVLESFHGLKLRWYLDASNETRRLLLTLAHAHGVLLSLINVVFGLTLASAARQERWQRIASPCLIGATVALPGGFFLGGVWVYGGDPGLGVLLSPIGALLLLVALFLTARGSQ